MSLACGWLPRTWGKYIVTGELYETISGTRQRTHQSIFDSCLRVLGLETAEKLGKEDRQALIGLLGKQDFFSLRKSVPWLSEKLGISKYTLYKDLTDLGIK